MSSQKCEALEPLPPLPMTKTKRPLLVAVVHGVGQRLDLGGIDAQQFLADALQKRPDVQLGSEHDGSPIYSVKPVFDCAAPARFSK